MGRRDEVFISVVRIPGVGDESEDFGGNAVDWGEPVLQGPNQTENLESVPLQPVNLKRGATQ